MKLLPENVTHYASSPEFNENSVPRRLLTSHQTKAGTWAKIVVLEGRIRFRNLEDDFSEIDLSIDQPGVVEPEVRHLIEPLGRVRFFLEFYR